MEHINNIEYLYFIIGFTFSNLFAEAIKYVGNKVYIKIDKRFNTPLD